jgi:hypothetical protein
MASQVLSGAQNPSYTNNTGQNVRVIINFMSSRYSGSGISGSNSGITINWAGVSASAPNAIAIGKNLAYHVGGGAVSVGLNFTANNMAVFEAGFAQESNQALPTEIMLANGQSFSATCGVYNVVVIREDGT